MRGSCDPPRAPELLGSTKKRLIIFIGEKTCLLPQKSSVSVFPIEHVAAAPLMSLSDLLVRHKGDRHLLGWSINFTSFLQSKPSKCFGKKLSLHLGVFFTVTCGGIKEK